MSDECRNVWDDELNESHCSCYPYGAPCCNCMAVCPEDEQDAS